MISTFLQLKENKCVEQLHGLIVFRINVENSLSKICSYFVFRVSINTETNCRTVVESVAVW